MLGDVFGGRKAKQRNGPAERKGGLPKCVYSPQVPQPTEDLASWTLKVTGQPKDHLVSLSGLNPLAVLT